MHVIRKYLCYSSELAKIAQVWDAWWKRLFFIFHQTDREKQELAPVTNWLYCMNHIFPAIDQPSYVQTSRGVHHITDSGQSCKNKACFFFCIALGEFYILGKSEIFAVFLSVRKYKPMVEWTKCQRSLAVSQHAALYMILWTKLYPHY